MNKEQSSNFWASVLDNFPLLKSDREIVESFRRDPDGRGFLSVAELLKSCKFHEESLELLQIGVGKHPRFTAARVVLAKEFFGRGMIEEALAIIDESPVNLRLNIMAQKIKLKSLLLLGDEDRFRQLLSFLSDNDAMDDECERLVRCFHVEGFSKARISFVEYLARHGVVVSLSRQITTAKESTRCVDSSPSDLSKYWVMPVEEIFFLDKDRSRHDQSLADLDTKTLAQIYEDQGHLVSALRIYRKLLSKFPSNTFYRHKVIELAQLAKKQKTSDLALDPATITKMEQLDHIEFRLEKCRTFLQKLR